jgi:NCAIR mutase (PurE)-related protein
VNRDELRSLLERVRAGDLDVDAAIGDFARLPFVDLPDARVDTHRAIRHGLPEVIYGPGKTAKQIVDIARALRDAGQNVLATRVEAPVAREVRDAMPEAVFEEASRLLWVGPDDVPECGVGTILVIAAGTSDVPVAMEAAGVARRFGNRVETLIDVGVAGLHRLLASSERLRAARVVIAVAGMEGALPSVVGGLVDRPVIAVPTSVGYGASFGGVTALLGMLTSCASNVSVVNIDNGFGAAYVATLFNRA